MNNKDNIIQAINYIEDNLDKDINVQIISSNIGYSYFHFSRLFQAVCGHTPSDYIQKRKLTEAAKKINNTTCRLTDIAFDYGYNDYETFTRAFKRNFGLNPTDIRQKGFNKFIPFLSRITNVDINHIDKIKDIEPEIVVLDNIYLVGNSTLVNGPTNVITELWSKFDLDYKDINNRTIPERFYEVHYWPEKYELDGFYVMCALEANSLDIQNPVLNIKIIPPAKYLKFIHKGLSRNVGMTYKYIFQTWLPKSNYKLSIPYEFEFYGDKYIGPDNEDSESEIYIPIERIVN